MSPSAAAISQCSTALLGWLLQAVLFGTLAAVLTWFISRLLGRRLPPAIVAALWSVVLLKFLAPTGPQLPFSLHSVMDAVSRNSLTAHTLLDESWGALPGVAEAPNPGASGGRQAAGIELGWQSLLGALYLAAAASFLGLRIRRYRLFAAACRALPRADAATVAVAANVCRRLGLRRVPRVLVSETMPAPFVTGLLDPVLVLHRSQLHRPDELETMVVHEMSHLRRGDLLVRGLQGLAASMFFFWPVVALVNRRIDAARELACDQWALRHGSLSAGDYARCLLRVASRAPVPVGAHGPARMAGRISNLERRIDMILQSSQQPAGRARARVLAAALIVTWGGFVLSGAVDATPSQEITERSVKEHAASIYARIAAYPTADVNGNGDIDFEERNAFLAASLLEDPASLLACFPYSAPFQGKSLELMDAYDLVRGLTYHRGCGLEAKQAIANAERSGAPDEQLKELQWRHQAAGLEATEVVLRAQESLLDRMAVVPEAEAVAYASQYITNLKKKEQTLKELALKAHAIEQKIQQLEADGRSAEADELKELLRKIEAASGQN